MRFTRFIVTALISGAIAGPVDLAGQEPDTPTQVDARPVAPNADNGSFEGYRFLDADGVPLPFQSDEEIEAYLASASVVSVKKIPVGVSNPKKVLLAGEALRLNAVFKDIEVEKRNVRDPGSAGRGKLYLVWRDSYTFDIAAYRLDRLLGLNRVAPVIARRIKGNRGSLQIWLERTITENERREKGYEPPEIARVNQQRSTLRIFDNLVANRDANLGNTLIDGNWRLWFIDCSRCFGRSPDLLYPDSITHCERRLWKSLGQLDRDEADEALSPYLGPAEIDALLERRDKIVDLLQKRIDDWGEELVLFDQRPPTETAPWIGREP
jgi:hypothetical protein